MVGVNVQINVVPFDEEQEQDPDAAESSSRLANANAEYLQQLTTSGKWGDGVMLCAATRLYQRRILVVMSKEDNTCVDIDLKPDVLITAAPICIGYVSANHYVLLKPKASKEAAFTSSPTPSASVGTSGIAGKIKPTVHRIANCNSQISHCVLDVSVVSFRLSERLKNSSFN